MSAGISCPLCAWHHDVPALDPLAMDPRTLAGVFGMGVMASVAVMQQNEATERALDAHLKTHALLEWVRKVTSLQTELDRLKAQFP